MILCIHFYCTMKRLLGIFIAIAIVTLAGYNVYASMNKEVKISKMALANVEALARDEGSSGNKCTVISYEDVWSGGCLYYCAKCAEGYYQVIALRHCNAR